MTSSVPPMKTRILQHKDCGITRAAAQVYDGIDDGRGYGDARSQSPVDWWCDLFVLLHTLVVGGLGMHYGEGKTTSFLRGAFKLTKGTKTFF